MILQQPQDPQDVADDLASFLALCWKALEYGADSAVRFFVAEKRNVDDQGLAAHLTRYAAKRYLENHNTHADFEQEDLPFSGLLVYVVTASRRYVIRIRRSADGTLPMPATYALEAFYRQPRQRYLPGMEPPKEGPEGIPQTHLMVIWRTPRDYSRVTSLVIACPKYVTKDEVKTHWEFEVPHPAITRPDSDSDGPEGVPDMHDLPMEDLPRSATLDDEVE